MHCLNRAITGFAILAFVWGIASAGEEEPREPDLRELVKQLGDEEFEVREKAMEKLMAMGKEAGRALLPYRDHEDIEVRARVGQVLEALGILTPEQEKALKTLLGRLFKVPGAERAGILEKIAGLGREALRQLEAKLLVPASQLKATCLPPAKWFTAGKVKHPGWRVRLVNAGKTPVLVPPPMVRRGGGSHGPLVFWRPNSPIDQTMFGFAHCSSRRYTISQARVLPPGGSVVLSAKPVTLKRPGLWTLYFDVQVEGKARLDGRSIRFGASNSCRTDGDGKLHTVRAECTVHAFPDWSSARSCRGVTISIVPGKETVRTGESLEAEVRLENQGEQTVRVEESWARYTWVALAERDGKASVASTAFVLRFPKTPAGVAPKKLTPFDLLPGKKVVRPIAVAVPETPGTYFLSCGYDLLPPKDWKPEGDEEPPTESLVARAALVKVLPPK